MACTTNQHLTNRMRGVALVIVLWMLALLTIIAAGYSATMRTETRLTTRQLYAAQARAEAEAGVWLAVGDLFKPEPERRWRVDGTGREVSLTDGTVELSIQDQSGMIDLNTANPELLQGLFVTTGLAADEAARVVDAIQDWRDRDNLTRANGTEDAAYRKAGLAYGAKNGPFNSVDELRRVLGMTETIYQKVAPMLTIYSHLSGINPTVAPASVLHALPDTDPATIDRIIAARSTPGEAGAISIATDINAIFTTQNKGVSYIIDSTADVHDAKVNLEVVVSLRRTSNLPYTILSWREL